MTDAIEIEGSPERAADRGRAEDLGFSMSEKPSLGNADVVRALVSEFAGKVVEIRKNYNLDKLTGEQAQVRLRALAHQYGDTIMGRNSAYDSMPWNSERQLGLHIRLVTTDIEGVDDPGEQLFLTVGTSLSTLAASHEAGKVTDQAAEHHAKVMLEDTALLISGAR